jgi:hypothetical protein
MECVVTSQNCDYWLGGKGNYAADRAVAEGALKVNPGLAPSAHANRALLGRAVRSLVGEAALVEPGLARVEERRPEPAAGAARKSIMRCAAGRKP